MARPLARTNIDCRNRLDADDLLIASEEGSVLDLIIDPDLDLIIDPDLDLIIDPDLDLIIDPDLDFIIDPDLDLIIDPYNWTL